MHCLLSPRLRAPNLELCGHPPYNTALYHTIAASIDITPSCGILDGVLRYNTSLDGLIRHRAVFGALGACYTVPCGLTRLRPSKDGSSLYSMLIGRFLRLPAAEPLIHRSSCPDNLIEQACSGTCARLTLRRVTPSTSSAHRRAHVTA